MSIIDKKILYINWDSGDVIDSEGAIKMDRPNISYGSAPVWQLRFVRVQNDNSLSGIDLSNVVSYHAAVDTDFLSSTLPMIRTLDSDIDHSLAGSGIISVSMNACTETFFNKVDGRNTIGAYFEVRGNDSDDKCILDYRFPVNALGAVDPQGGDPIPVASGGVTINDVYALLRSATEYRFSADGTNWHPTQQTGDIYYESRYPQGEWSEPIELVAGSDGADGYNVKFEYSVDKTSWHTTPTSADFYFRNSNDNGSTWTTGILFRGADGANGIGFELLGEYNAETTYNPPSLGNYECVFYNGSTYAYINSTAASGHTPPATSDSYWMKIAAQGSVENITVSDITDFDSVMSGLLSGFATKGEVYTTSQMNTLLAAKANVEDVYLRDEANAHFVDNEELAALRGTLVTLQQWSDQNTIFQGEINYLSGQISGGGGGDLSNYYTKSEVNSISAYLQNEIDNIPSGGGGGGASGTVESINFNGESLLPDNGVITLNALPMAIALPNPTRTEQNFCLYLGQNVNGDDYVGSLYAPDFGDSYTSGFNIPINSNISLTGTNRVWEGTDSIDVKWKVEYNDSAWRIYKTYNSEEPWELYATQISAYSTGQPWGAYEWVNSATFHPHLIPANDFMDGKKGHLYEKEGDYNNDKLLITYMQNGQKVEVWLKRVYSGGTALDQWTYDGQPAGTSYPGRIVRVLSTTGSPAGIWTYDDDTLTYETGSTGNTDEPWKFNNEEFAYHSSVDPSEDATIYITIKRLFKGGWMDIGSMLH